ncbi:MAG: hypothetical protein U9R48_06860 [Chloroflexota bacterium]|nr:hypothetical protein [Chloroflexota bacterium]
MMPIAHETYFSPLIQIVRRRVLPTAGELLVHRGDRVIPTDTVAHCFLPGRIRVIDVAGALGVNAARAARQMQVAVGDHVKAGDILAKPSLLNWPREQVLAPFDGTVQDVGDGYIFLRQDPRPYALRAYIPGEVVETYPHRGVSVRTTGAYVRGVWGSGGEGTGVLVVTASDAAEPLTWEQVSLRYRGAILVGGLLQDHRVLFRAQQFRLGGVVVGSVPAGLRSVCEGLDIPLVVTEGVGRIPMAEAIFRTLRAYRGRPAVISGTPDEEKDVEVIVPLQAEEEPTMLPAVSQPLQEGAWVRLTRPPYLGLLGEIVSLPEAPRETDIGTRAEGAMVELSSGRRVFVPYVNMERLG